MRPIPLGARSRSDIAAPEDGRTPPRRSPAVADPVLRAVHQFLKSLNFEPIILDDRVTQEFVAGIGDLLPRGLLVRAVELDFHVLADAHGADATVAQVREGVLHGLALGIEHSFFGRNNNFGFHHRRTGTNCLRAC